MLALMIEYELQINLNNQIKRKKINSTGTTIIGCIAHLRCMNYLCRILQIAACKSLVKLLHVRVWSMLMIQDIEIKEEGREHKREIRGQNDQYQIHFPHWIITVDM